MKCNNTFYKKVHQLHETLEIEKGKVTSKKKMRMIKRR